jgi:hypothetical protein
MSSDMEELRRRALEQEEVVEGYESSMVRNVRSDKLFGMTAVERMFVSIGCFLVTSLAGFLVLLVMGKIALP